MSRIDLHPEELVDRERGGALTAVERERLDAHAAACGPCAFERVAAADFAAEMRQDWPGDAAAVERIVAGAVAQAAGRPAAVRRAGLVEPRAGRWARRVLVAAVVATLATGVAATALYLVFVPSREPPSRPAPAAVCPPAPEPPPPGAASPQVPGGRDRRAAPAEEPPPAPPPSTGEVPAPAAQPAPAPHRGRPGLPAPPPPPAAAAPEDTPGSLLRHANAARRAGDYAEALRVYGDLAARFPGSREEVLARVTVGWLRLERLGDPGGALASFDAYLAASPDGTLAEESLVGRALALMQLGRAVEERAAWETLLARFPDSANAGRARRRLAELP